MIYGTFLGGSGWDFGYGIAADASGNAYVTGYTLSTNFPATPGAFKTTKGGDRDAFVAKLNRPARPSSTVRSLGEITWITAMESQWTHPKTHT
ncbi:hypothetical protein SDC9_197095 [bioreactor metagenome]|uniref:Beta-propeller repeat protein n=1 Tax=bioreactor metagenome TaxID=1076179 RepID=A0A645IMD6_9ZZZZ